MQSFYFIQETQFKMHVKLEGKEHLEESARFKE
jgi:hypothetical protein